MRQQTQQSDQTCEMIACPYWTEFISIQLVYIISIFFSFLKSSSILSILTHVICEVPSRPCLPSHNLNIYLIIPGHSVLWLLCSVRSNAAHCKANTTPAEKCLSFTNALQKRPFSLKNILVSAFLKIEHLCCVPATSQVGCQNLLQKLKKHFGFSKVESFTHH